MPSSWSCIRKCLIRSSPSSPIREDLCNTSHCPALPCVLQSGTVASASIAVEMSALFVAVVSSGCCPVMLALGSLCTMACCFHLFVSFVHGCELTVVTSQWPFPSPFVARFPLQLKEDYVFLSTLHRSVGVVDMASSHEPNCQNCKYVIKILDMYDQIQIRSHMLFRLMFTAACGSAATQARPTE
jgi:hypothetical protein